MPGADDAVNVTDERPVETFAFILHVMHRRPLAFRVGALLLQVLLLSGWGGGLLCLASDGDVNGLHGSFAAAAEGVHHAESAESSQHVHHAEQMQHAEGAENAEGARLHAHGHSAADESPAGRTTPAPDSCGLMVICSAVAVIAIAADAPPLALAVAAQVEEEPSFDLLSASSSVEPPPPRA